MRTAVILRQSWPLILLMSFILVLTAACGSSAEPTVPADQDVTADIEMIMDDMQFSPNRLVGKPGETIEILLRNPDTMKHDFTFDAIEGEEIQVALEPRNSITFTLTFPDEPGEWPFYCSIPGHQQLGMEGVLVVEE